MIAFVLLIGLLIGFYAKDLHVKVTEVYQDRHEQREAEKAGVVRPNITKLTRNTPIDLSSDTGSVRRPSPNDLAIQSMIANEKAKNEALR